jgi:hypothetical protein
MRARARTASIVAATLCVVAAGCTGGTDGVDGPSATGPSTDVPACPHLGEPRRIGRIGGEGADRDLAAQGISGLGVSADDQTGPILWALGDRYANELAGDDSVLLLALNPKNGEELSRFMIDGSSLELGPGGDPVTSLEDVNDAVPDFEDLAVEPMADGTNRLWLFDTGNNEGNRDHLNAYVADAPDPSPSLGGGVIDTIRYPFELQAHGDYPALNTEAALVDPAHADTPATVYVIPKFPVDLDHDGSASDFQVFAFQPDPEDTSAAMNEATVVGHITLDDPALQVSGASASQDGTAFAIRAVSGGQEGQPNLDLVGLWQRDPDTSITDVLEERPAPDCTWSFDTARGSSAEETLAFDLRDGPAWSGLLWTHDERDPGAPLFAVARR